MDGYWRGARNQLRLWRAFYTGAQADQVPTEPSLFARWVQEYVDDDHEVVDVGAGTGRDAVFFAAEGHPVVALDYAGPARVRARKLARSAGVDVQVRHINLYDARTTLTAGAQLAHDPKPRHVYSRLVVDALSAPARQELYRFADMVTRRGGRTFLEFKARGRASPETVMDEIVARGGTIECHEQGRNLAPLGNRNPVMCRLVVRWNR